MTKEIEVLIDGDLDYLEVDFTAQTRIENDSFTHAFGTEEKPDYVKVDGEIEWNKEPFTKDQNKAIAEYLAVVENWKTIAEGIEDEVVADYE